MIRPISEFSKSIKDVSRFIGAEIESEIIIRGISTSSQNIEPGDLFIALPGSKSHGVNFLNEAINKGAVAVLTDEEGAKLSSDKLPTLIVEKPRAIIGPLSDWFYNSPSAKFKLVGITGTNGKTTTSYLLNQIWKSAGKSTALIGTLGVEICGEPIRTKFTTPEADQLINIFASASERHITHGVMEVSSIGIEMGRVSGTHFSLVAFTNLTQDHLDFHGNMENYGRAKAKLFSLEYAENAVINIDDPFGIRLFNESTIPAISVSRNNRSAIWRYENIEVNKFTTLISIRGDGGILIEGQTSLIGEHNLDNLLMAIALAYHSGVDPLVISATISNLKGAPGRLEVVNIGQDFLAIVDYAHTPDAVTHALSTTKKLSNRTIAVLGCGGDRDSTKRQLMGIALSKGSDLAIYTSDNPRSESAEVILDQMTAGITLDASNVRIVDRREAIAFAVANATSGDCVIILGKGHEIGQEIKGQVYPFDDKIELATAIEKLS